MGPYKARGTCNLAARLKDCLGVSRAGEWKGYMHLDKQAQGRERTVLFLTVSK